MRAAWVLLLIAACGKTASPAPVPARTSSLVPAVEAGAPPGIAPVETAVIAPGVDRERARVALAICEAAYDPESRAVGCTSHPPFASPAAPGGKLAPFTGDFSGLCRIDDLVPGSYTRGGADELLVSFEACAMDGTWDAGFPGSAIVVERASLRPVAYAGRDISRRCVRPVVDGRTVFVCSASFDATVAGRLDSVYLVDFARPENVAVTLAQVWSQDSCDDGMASPRAGYSKVEMGELALKGGDVTVRVRRAWAAPTAAFLARTKAICAERMAPVGRLLPPAQSTTLTFARANGFRPGAATAAVLARWAKETAGIHGGLEGSAPPLLE